MLYFSARDSQINQEITDFEHFFACKVCWAMLDVSLLKHLAGESPDKSRNVISSKNCCKLHDLSGDRIS